MARLGLTDCVSISRKRGPVFVIPRSSLGRPYRQTDTIGRLDAREDRRTAQREDFTYDALNRLKTVQLRLNSGSPITMLSLTYDVLGNLCSKNGVVYAYNGLDNCNATDQNASASPLAVSDQPSDLSFGCGM
ncbi:MAG TPA: hypothetical protein PK216_06360 [Aquimonas sp.]|nr:hypothetical protein [Aquimonas sp.]